MEDIPVTTERDNVPDWAKQPGSSGQSMAPPGTSGGLSGPKISDPQRKYLLHLIRTKSIKRSEEGKLDLIMKCLRISEDPEEYGMSKAKASELITWFLKQPDKPLALTASPEQGPAGLWPEVPSGRYAVDSNEGELRFYQVWRPKGKPYIMRLYVLHGPDSSQVHRNAVDAIMKKIAADPRAAAIRFGNEIGACSNCGRRLTNRISRELAIGPVCGGRLWEETEWKQLVRDKRQEIIARGEDPDEEIV